MGPRIIAGFHGLSLKVWHKVRVNPRRAFCAKSAGFFLYFEIEGGFLKSLKFNFNSLEAK